MMMSFGGCDNDAAQSEVRTARVVKIKLLRRVEDDTSLLLREEGCALCVSGCRLLESRVGLLEGSLLAAREANEDLQHKERVADLKLRKARDAITISEEALEGYDVLVSLLEAELGLLLANCSAHLGAEEDAAGELIDAAARNKQTADAAASEFVNNNNVNRDNGCLETEVRCRLVTLRNRLLQLTQNLQQQPQQPESEEEHLQKKEMNPQQRTTTDLETLVLLEELSELRHERNLLKQRLLNRN